MCCVLLPSWWTKQWLEQEKLYSYNPGCWKLNSHCWIVLYCNLKVAGSWQSILKLVSRMSSHWSLSLEAGKMRLPLLAVLTSQVKKIVNYFFQAMSCRTSPPPPKVVVLFSCSVNIPWSLNSPELKCPSHFCMTKNIRTVRSRFLMCKTTPQQTMTKWQQQKMHQNIFVSRLFFNQEKSSNIQSIIFFGRMNLTRSFFPERSS